MSEKEKLDAYDQAVNVAIANLINVRIAEVIQMINRDIDSAAEKGLSLFRVSLLHNADSGASVMCSFGELKAKEAAE